MAEPDDATEEPFDPVVPVLPWEPDPSEAVYEELAAEAGPSVPAPPAEPPEEEGPAPRLPMASHLEELRARILVCLAALVPPFVAALIAYRWVWEGMLWPARAAAARLERPFEEVIRFFPGGMADVLALAVEMALWLAAAVALPVLLYQLWVFVAPGLTGTERHRLRIAFGTGGALFLLGAAVGFLWAAPLALAFLLSFNTSLAGVEGMYTFDRYLGFVTTLALGFGAAFETPLAMWLLARFGLLKSASLRRWWRHGVVAVFAVAAVATPPEPASQVLLAGVLLILLAAGYGLVRLAERRAERAVAPDGGA